ncbi:MAG: hypothetical protein U0792_07140 [Gemmataceae bacterium]
MPLRDHFHPPLQNNPNAKHHGELGHDAAATAEHRRIANRLPCRARGVWRSALTIDLGTLQDTSVNGASNAGRVGVAVATQRYAPPAILSGDVSFADADLFEVRVLSEDGRIAAAIELVSRSNKDRPDASACSRQSAPVASKRASPLCSLIS